MFARIKFVLITILLLGAVALVTAPGQGAAELKMRAALEARLAGADLGRVETPLGKVALAACKLDPDSCYSLVREQIETQYQHRVVYSVFRAEGFGKTATCYGAFTRYFCPGGLIDLAG